MRFSIVIVALVFLTAFGSTLASEAKKCDVVVYGATPGGIAAAVNAAREGCSVILVQENDHIGGLTSGGLSHTDFLTFESLGGTWWDFMTRIEDHYAKIYGRDSVQVRDCWRGAYYEPHVAKAVFEAMLNEEKVSVLKWHRLAKVITEEVAKRKRVTRATFTDLATNREVEVSARVFIDGTYEGDLLAAAGAEYRLGCDAKTEFNESLAPAEANKHVMVMNFRVTLSRDKANCLPLPKPQGYDRARYAKAAELIAAGTVKKREYGGAGWPLDDFLRARPLPNQKADFNDRWGSPLSIRLFAEAAEWPEATPIRRAEIFQQAKAETLGLFWFLANDPELPAWVREGMSAWGIPKDEYQDTDYWPPVLYLREGRRLVGVETFTQSDCEIRPNQVRSRLNNTAVAIGDYGIDSHGTHLGKNGELMGKIGAETRPFQIPYGVMVPKSVDGLLVPVALSASHVGYCAVRLEPTWTALGQAAGVAAAQSVHGEINLRDVSIPKLQRRLHALGAKTIYVSDVDEKSKYFAAVQWFGTQGYFHDLVPVEKATEWKRTSLSPTNQWTTMFPYHACGVDTPIDAALAEKWLKAAGVVADDPLLAVDGKRTRGEFLQRLYELGRF